jgi:hypothetical protein
MRRGVCPHRPRGRGWLAEFRERRIRDKIDDWEVNVRMEMEMDAPIPSALVQQIVLKSCLGD